MYVLQFSWFLAAFLTLEPVFGKDFDRCLNKIVLEFEKGKQ